MEQLVSKVSLSKKDFLRFSKFIHTEFGIKMPPAKKVLLESRLQKRLRKLELKTFEEYHDYLFSPEGRTNELPQFINQITTNKTDFFREPNHFDFLSQEALPNLMKNHRGAHTNLTVWSAGCSTGEEPYTLAIILNEYISKNPNLRLNFSIFATDISSEVIQKAKQAVYKQAMVAPIPLMLKKKYLLKSKDKRSDLVRVVPELRWQVEFERLNFMDKDYGLKKPVDIIFCRNVLIYFDRPTQEAILNRLCRYLKKGGFFFQGHSESVQGMDLPLKPVFPTIYQKT
ncbi:MAG: chemotaxis protein CheR [Deltaproteobacteria bacterium]|nr:chemotaxis protein CheR [Deltaproteobacteria bacterium]MBT7483211.1 chemotaxis protein CheR [Candidatus Peregrinibacteria bacterium]MBT4087524.1 chemotaxis protein CheR [Deltaproteobacteria bacterium]MBT4265349.1 chemotaxis protein CheR [Deltaproteobacteria bacterium]MBT4643550.1 chemotaxis protein CheR [Deltaproteobacteria bacterium]